MVNKLLFLKSAFCTSRSIQAEIILSFFEKKRRKETFLFFVFLSLTILLFRSFFLTDILSIHFYFLQPNYLFFYSMHIRKTCEDSNISHIVNGPLNYFHNANYFV